jgi:hypothetical protein
VDDIMLSISDEESGKSGSPKLETSKNSPDSASTDPNIKPNFVYIVSLFTSTIMKP